MIAAAVLADTKVRGCHKHTHKRTQNHFTKQAPRAQSYIFIRMQYLIDINTISGMMQIIILILSQ